MTLQASLVYKTLVTFLSDNKHYMNTITNSGIRNMGLALAALLSIALFVAVAPKAQAADLFGDFGYGDYYPDMGGMSDFGYGDYYPSMSDFGYGDYYPSYSDFGYGDYYPTSGFSDFGGFSSGGWSMPFSSMPTGGGNMQSQSQSQGQSQSQSSTNVNNNNNVNNISINVPQAQPTVAQPVCPVGTTGIYPNCVYPQTPTYDICPNLPGIQSTLPAGYVMQYGNCQYQTIYPTPAPQPYVTLSQVPYTGLELGPVGTVVYWGFLVLWCLMAAYLIAVKKVQNKVVAWFAGSTPSHARVSHAAPAAHAPVVKVATPVSGIDPFIQSQIHRSN